MYLFNLVLFLAISFIGGYLGYILRLPIGVILGAMFSVGLSKYFGLLHFESANWLSLSNQIMLGLMLGVGFVKIEWQKIKALSVGLIIIAVGVFIMTLVTASALTYFTPLNTKTAIIASAPAAIAEMSILANTLGLNTPIIVLLHLVRVVSVMLLFSFILRYFHNKSIREERENEYMG